MKLKPNFLALIVLFAASHAAAENPVAQLSDWLDKNVLDEASATELSRISWANERLSKAESQLASDRLWEARKAHLKKSRRDEHDARVIEMNNQKMPFWYRVFGESPKSGRSLYISMHGGGGAPSRVNDQQYENQKRLYQPKEGVYLVPRAPTDTWNLWHEKHIDEFFDRLITNMIVFEGVDPDRVYLMGYSAGGDGVYQLSPRMADRFAAVSMMAGHPNETKPDGLRNLPFALFMGGDDSAYDRNRHAADWEKLLGELRKQDPEGYKHKVTIFEGMGHWMQRKDAVALPWMAEFRRNRHPDRIVWRQDDVTHQRSYWLFAKSNVSAGDRVVATIQDNHICIEESSVPHLEILLHDDFVDLDQNVTFSLDNQPSETRLSQSPARTIQTLVETLLERDDPAMVFSSKIVVSTSQESSPISGD